MKMSLLFNSGEPREQAAFLAALLQNVTLPAKRKSAVQKVLCDLICSIEDISPPQAAATMAAFRKPAAPARSGAKTRQITLEVSEELASLATGFAGISTDPSKATSSAPYSRPSKRIARPITT